MYRGAQGSQNNWGAIALPLAHPITMYQLSTAGREVDVQVRA